MICKRVTRNIIYISAVAVTVAVDVAVAVDENKKEIWPLMGSKTVGIFGTFSAIGSYIVGGKIKQNLKRCEQQGVEGNLKGEGTKLGGVWVIGSGDQGVLFQHNEKKWGDIAVPEMVMAAVANIQTAQTGESSTSSDNRGPTGVSN
jgi:hypothetical protein